MAKVIRYFSTAAAGLGDGTSWADRAAFPASSSIITTFDHTSDTLESRFGPGVYTLTAALVAPAGITSVNKNILHGCDSSGNLLPGQDGWVSSQGEFDYSSYPVFDTPTNIRIIEGAFIVRCMTLRSSGSGTKSNTLTTGCREFQWVTIDANTTNTNTGWTVLNGTSFNDCQILIPSAAFNLVVSNTSTARFVNVRATTGSVLGTRSFLATASTNANFNIQNCFFSGFNQAIRNAAGFTVGQATLIRNNTIVNCVDGISQESSGAQSTNTSLYRVERNYVANCSGFGISQLTFDYGTAVCNRVRDCTSGLITNFADEYDNITTAGTDADEFVNAAGGDYRIKYGSAIWGLGIGAGDEPASGGGPALTPSIRGYTF